MPEQEDPTPREGKGDPNPANAISKALIDHVAVSLEAFLGEARMTVAELSGLEEESIVTLGTTLGQAVELRLNGLCVAKGELVAVGDHFAVRLTEISR